MSHAFARRGRDAGDEADYRFLHVGLDPTRAVFLIGSADFADHDDCFGSGIVVEHFHDVYVLQAVDRITADADARRLSQALLAQLPDRLVGERAGTRDHADRTLLVNVPRHDADFDFIRRDYTR